MPRALRGAVSKVATSFDANRYVKDFERAWNAKDPSINLANYADNVELRDPISSEPLRGKEKAMENTKAWFEAFSEMEIRLKESVVQGSKAALLYECTGRHTGDFHLAPGETIPATNKRASVEVTEFVTLDAQGKVTKDVVLMDSGKLLTQLGIIPQPGATQAGGKRTVTR